MQRKGARAEAFFPLGGKSGICVIGDKQWVKALTKLGPLQF
jgi:hypothetical protein